MLTSVQRRTLLLLSLPLLVASIGTGCGGGAAKSFGDDTPGTGGKGAGGAAGSGQSGGSGGVGLGGSGGIGQSGTGGQGGARDGETGGGSGGQLAGSGGGGGANAGGSGGRVTGSGGRAGNGGGTRDGGTSDGATVDGGARGYCDQDKDCVFRANDSFCGACLAVDDTPVQQFCPGILCVRPPGGCSCKNHMCERGALMQGDTCQLQQDACGSGLKCCRLCGTPDCMATPKCTQSSSLGNGCPLVPLSP
ncbi:MAG: hypothetical protein ABI560_02800 [Myxococcales bacterium]